MEMVADAALLLQVLRSGVRLSEHAQHSLPASQTSLRQGKGDCKSTFEERCLRAEDIMVYRPGPVLESA